MNKLRSLIPLVERLDSAVVGCVGDLMLDSFIQGSVSRISPEAPIPILRVDSQMSMLGGMGNVVRNLGALGCEIRAFSVTGEDPAGREINQMLKVIPRCQAWVYTEEGRQTPVKVRHIADGQQLLRVDYELDQVISETSLKVILKNFEETVSECSVVVLSDYAKGTLGGSIASKFIGIAASLGKTLIVDPKGRDYSRYRGATVIKPNLKELGEVSGTPVNTLPEQESAARRLIEQTFCDFILVTRGAEGMLLVPSDGPAVEFASQAREVFDVSGAGDTVASVLAAALGAGVSIEDAVSIANIAGGIAVGKAGTAVVPRLDIVHEIEHQSSSAVSDKVLRPDEIQERVLTWRRMGLKIGFVFGSFDLLSHGHLAFLEKARSDCDRLVIALRHDPMSFRNGLPETVQACRTRAYVIASLVFSDAVVMCEDHASAALLGTFCPDTVSTLPDTSSDPVFSCALNSICIAGHQWENDRKRDA
jgi:D-beta-D-heptose 7-phosphate kinase/D-beta-D-heptose 1-phosphate adenosyltransferase